jgi:hypothetical protein
LIFRKNHCTDQEKNLFIYCLRHWHRL